ncbi:MAG: hypothetical protein DWI22_12695 [Planctomycetota bacterium]|nr:MAG: hypothetical protein DWI22_12695 [Planctomycetota bacterium]
MKLKNPTPFSSIDAAHRRNLGNKGRIDKRASAPSVGMSQKGQGQTTLNRVNRSVPSRLSVRSVLWLLRAASAESLKSVLTDL